MYKYRYSKPFNYAGFILSTADGFGLWTVHHPFIKVVSQAQLSTQLQLSLQSDPIALRVPNST